MKKSAVLMVFICLVFAAKSQNISNSPSQMYALGYTFGKKVYDLVNNAPVPTPVTIQNQVLSIEQRKDGLYDQIMETYHAPVTANAFLAGYLNGLINTGVSTVPSSGYSYTVPPTGSSLNNKLNYDASILYPLGNNTRNYLENGTVTVTSGGAQGIMSITLDTSVPDTIIIKITFK